MASFGSLCRQGADTSHFAVVGALARSYLGPTVHPASSGTRPAAKTEDRKNFFWDITALLRALRSGLEFWAVELTPEPRGRLAAQARPLARSVLRARPGLHRASQRDLRRSNRWVPIPARLQALFQSLGRSSTGEDASYDSRLPPRRANPPRGRAGRSQELALGKRQPSLASAPERSRPERVEHYGSVHPL